MVHVMVMLVLGDALRFDLWRSILGNVLSECNYCSLMRSFVEYCILQMNSPSACIQTSVRDHQKILSQDLSKDNIARKYQRSVINSSWTSASINWYHQSSCLVVEWDMRVGFINRFTFIRMINFPLTNKMYPPSLSIIWLIKNSCNWCSLYWLMML